MTLELSTYVDPGTYIGEVVVGGAVNIATVPAVLGIVGIGSREKGITNEQVIRGNVEGAALTFIAPSGTGATGTDSISAPSGGRQTLTIAGSAFGTQVIGSSVTIRNDPNPTNNGTFPVVDRPSATSIVYTNAGGVANAAFGGTYAVKPYAIVGGLATPVRTNRALQNTTVFRDAKALSDSLLAFRRAHVETALAGPFALVAATNDAISIEMDGKVPLTLIFTAAAGASTVNGTQITVRQSTIAALATATLAEIIAAINEGLNPVDATANLAVSALGYGAAYAGAAQLITGTGLRLVSPTTTPASDVRVSNPFARTAVTTIFGAAGALNRDSPSIIELQRVAYNTASTYTIDYVNINDVSDTLLNSGVLSVSRIGTSPGVGKFQESIDFSVVVDSIDWSILSAATLIPTRGVAATFDLSVNDVIRLSIDGRPSIDFDLVGLPSPPLGYIAIGAPATAAIASVVANINAILANNANYGPRYQTVASVLTVAGLSYIRLTSPTTGTSSSVTISTPTTAPTNDATNILFGLASTQLPYSVTGIGRRPAIASQYFVTYSITRPDADYNVMKRFLSESLASADLGAAAAENPLMIAVRLAFRQKVSNLVVVQVDDSTLPGSPTRQELLDALQATERSDLVTEVVVLSTDLATQIDLKDHVEDQSSPTKKHYRRGYFGMAINTDPGDRDTPDTFVYRSTQTLQVSPDSPGRGRLVLVAPPQREGTSVDLKQVDGTIERVQLDSTFDAVMIAAKKASFKSPATSLALKTIIGFNVDDIDLGSIWADEERKTMANQGVMVVTFDAGNFKILDPVTTEGGGGGAPEFLYPACSSQKDNITRKVDKALTENIVGIVPTNLADFVTDIKEFIAGVLKGEIPGAIAPYTNADGSTRKIDLTTDIEVSQDPDDPTKFFFSYFFNLKFAALRLLGQYSVLNPFFAPSVAA